MKTQPYPVSSVDDLKETERLVADAGGEIIARKADVRDLESLRAAVRQGIDAFGGLNIVVANAGIWSTAPTWELEEDQWQEMIDINLTGVWKTVKATLPPMLERDVGGSIILISSLGGISGFMGLAHYTAAKHGIIGLMNVLAQEIGPRSIRVNAICPCSVNTMMFNNAFVRQSFCPETVNPSDEQFLTAARTMTILPIPYVEVTDVSNAVVFLASDDSPLYYWTTNEGGRRRLYKGILMSLISGA